MLVSEVTIPPEDNEIECSGHLRGRRASQIKQNELSTANAMKEVLAHKVKREHIEEYMANILV